MKAVSPWVWLALHCSAALLLVAGQHCHGQETNGDRRSAPRVRIGSKSYTENVILGEMLTLLAREAGSRAEHQAELGGTQIAFESLKKGDIDAYPEYTGTLTMEILSDYQPHSDADIERALSQSGIKISRRLGFNNSYALGVPRKLAADLKLR